MVDTFIETLVILSHYFKLDLKIGQATCSILWKRRNEAISEKAAENWFTLYNFAQTLKQGIYY